MMLAYITSLRHPQNADDYVRVEELLAATLASISQQTSEDHVVIVVGNQAPHFELPPRTRFIEVDFPPPAPPGGTSVTREAVVRDKGSKLGIGLIAAREHRPDYVMIFDADDFIHRDLTRWVSAQPPGPGWAVHEGWMFSRARNSYRPLDRFNRTCGTCHVVRFEAYGVPEDLTVLAQQEDVIAAYGERLFRIIGSHPYAEEWLAERGSPLGTVPFRAAAYHVDTGENHSRKSMSGIARPLDAAMRRDFAIPPSLDPFRTVMAAVGPRVLARGTARRLSRAVRKARGVR